MTGRIALVVLGGVAACGEDVDPRPARLAYIAPAILQPACATASCHSRQGEAAGLRFDRDDLGVLRSELILRTLIYVGQPEGSPLVTTFLRGANTDLRMPPDAPLPEADIALIEAWIAAGAPE
jgi:hypothetical protein